ncbi:MAG TPA: metallophosphoesterase [Bacteroidales bacterium]|nr:metallophosphoesterase [Bacteroidales bacterium]
MKILLFVLTVTTIYFAAHYYVFARVVYYLALTSPIRNYVFWGIATIASLFIAGMFLERAYSSLLSEWIYKIGTTWLAFFLYILLAIIAIDILYIISKIIPSLPTFSQKHRLILGAFVCVVVCITVLYGHIQAVRTQIVQIPITIHKKVEGKKNIRILMASDLHFGAIIGERWEKKFMNIVQQQNPDIVLLCGDIVDGDIGPVLRKKLGQHLQELQPSMGMYAITGNHEYIGGIDEALQYLTSINISVLRDTIITLPNGIQIVGRNDLHSGHQRPLDSLLKSADHTNPIIVMNHQPYNLREAVNQKVDLHLSGHTHHGQLWPFNYITQSMFELSWGYKQDQSTHLYVSSGFGTWGPTVRIGNKPEVVVFDLTFTEQ